MEDPAWHKPADIDPKIIGLPPEKWPSLRYGLRAIWRMQECPKKKHTPEEIVAKLRQVDVLVSQG